MYTPFHGMHTDLNAPGIVNITAYDASNLTHQVPVSLPHPVSIPVNLDTSHHIYRNQPQIIHGHHQPNNIFEHQPHMVPIAQFRDDGAMIQNQNVVVPVSMQQVQYREPQPQPQPMAPPPPQQIHREPEPQIQQLRDPPPPKPRNTTPKVPKPRVPSSGPGIQCHVCNKKLRSDRYLKCHMAQHTGERPFKCDYCPKTFITNDSLKYHIKLHDGTKNFKCSICDKAFARKAYCKEHVRNVHEGSKPYKCELCDSAFAKKDALKRHHRHMHNPAETSISGKPHPYKCSEAKCGKRFIYITALRKHELTHSKDETIHKILNDTSSSKLTCHICNRVMGGKKMLIEHILNVHEKYKPHKCDVCGKSYFKAAALKNHMDKHKKKKTHKCEFCNKAYTYQSALGQHLKIHYAKSNKFKCDICNKKFHSPMSLKRHKHIHRGKGPFKCDLCKSEFKSIYTLKYHKQKQHKKLFDRGSTHGVLQNSPAQNHNMYMGGDSDDDAMDSEGVSYNKDLATVDMEMFDASMVGTQYQIMGSNVYGYEQTGDQISNNPSNQMINVQQQQGYQQVQGYLDQQQGFLQQGYQTLEPISLHPNQPIEVPAGSYQCRICLKVLKSERSLTIHIDGVHTGNRPFQCDICQKRFTTRDTLKYHQKLHVAIKPYQCHLCHRAFARKAYMTEHISAVHEGAKPFQCVVCNMRFTKKCSLKNHMSRHSAHKPYGCTMCQMSFRTQSNLNRHKKLHSETGGYLCSYCKAEFVTYDQLRMHMREHDAQESAECTICHKVYKSVKYLRDHMEDVHEGLRPHKCEVCGKAFFKRYILTKHIVSQHLGTKSKLPSKITIPIHKIHRCAVCKKAFRHASQLLHHSWVHAEQKPFKCTLCDKAYTRERNLQEHMATHAEEKPYACDQCGKGFTKPWYLREHIQQKHEGIRPFECPQCDKAFFRRYLLKEHMRKHTNEKPEKCPVCNMRFATKCVLRNHMVTHKKEKEFKCEFCDREFHFNHELKKHRLNHTDPEKAKKNKDKVKEIRINCEICDKGFYYQYELKRHMKLHTLQVNNSKFSDLGLAPMTDFENPLPEHSDICSPDSPCVMHDTTLNSDHEGDTAKDKIADRENDSEAETFFENDYSLGSPARKDDSRSEHSEDNVNDPHASHDFSVNLNTPKAYNSDCGENFSGATIYDMKTE